MKVGSVGIHLHLVRMKKTVSSREKEGGDGYENSWIAQVARARHPFGRKHDMHLSKPGPVGQPDLESRTARLEQLREQIRTGNYVVNSRTLAERMLVNETHLIEGQPSD